MLRISPVRLGVGVLYLVLGAATILAYEKSILTPAHQLFFDRIPREAWGTVQIIVGAFMLRTRTHETAALLTGSVVAGVWAQVAIYPVIRDHSANWNIVSFLVWVGIWALCVLDTCRHMEWWPYNKRKAQRGA